MKNEPKKRLVRIDNLHLSKRFYYIVGGDCTVGACGYDLAKSFSLTSPTA